MVNCGLACIFTRNCPPPYGGISYDGSSTTHQASQGRERAAVQDRPPTPEKSRAPERAALHHRQPPYPARPVGAAGPLYRPARGPDRAQGKSRYDCPAGVRAVSGDPLNGQKQAIAVKAPRESLGIVQFFYPLFLSLLRRQ